MVTQGVNETLLASFSAARYAGLFRYDGFKFQLCVRAKMLYVDKQDT
jgi:hypothetical protein